MTNQKTLARNTKASALVAMFVCAGMGWCQDISMSGSVSIKISIVPSASAQRKAAKPIDAMTAGDVVAWLTPLDGTVSQSSTNRPRQIYRLVQKNKQFTPHLLVVPTGTSIDFPNEDPFFHNVFSLFNGKRFDLGLYEAGSHRSVRFDREGVSYIFCNIHPEMGAIVVSLKTPFYAVSRADGSLKISGVPAGVYELKLWSESVSAEDLAEAERKVRVTGADVQLGVISLPQSAHSAAGHKNKFGDEYKPTADNPY